MLRAAGTFFADRLSRWIPDSFVFAIGLTLLVAALAATTTPASAIDTLQAWYQGFFSLLEFGMQIVLILTTAYAIALSSVMTRLLDWVALRVNTPPRVYFSVVALGGLFSLVSWGWLVLAAVLARELAQRVKGVSYPYLVACAYFSGLTWVGGLSSSIPLLLNTPSNFLIERGVLDSTVSVRFTLGSGLNLLYLATFFVIGPLLIVLLAPRSNDSRDLGTFATDAPSSGRSVAEEAAPPGREQRSPSDRLNHSMLLALTVSAAGLIYVGHYFLSRGPDLNFNIMIFIFIMVGLLVHRTPMAYTIAMKRACSNVSGIVYQYPFYAGIMGMMQFTGLGESIARRMAEGGSVLTLPLTAQASGALVNFAIPSAGGEWAVIGPTFIEAARTLTEGVAPDQFESYVARIALSAAYGETSTNLMQPFFLLIILPVMGAGTSIRARDVMGYLVVPFAIMYGVTALLLIMAPV